MSFTDEITRIQSTPAEPDLASHAEGAGHVAPALDTFSDWLAHLNDFGHGAPAIAAKAAGAPINFPASPPPKTSAAETKAKDQRGTGMLDELFSDLTNAAVSAEKGITNAFGAGAGAVPHLPDAVKAPLQEAGQAFGQGAQKGALQGAGSPGGFLASIPAPIQIVGGIALAVVAGAMLFATRRRY